MVADELKIGALLRDEFAVRSKFDNVAAVKHDDLVGLADGAKPVSDDDDSATYREFTQCPVNCRFCARVECTSGFIEEKEIRHAIDGAGE